MVDSQESQFSSPKEHSDHPKPPKVDQTGQHCVVQAAATAERPGLMVFLSKRGTQSYAVSGLLFCFCLLLFDNLGPLGCSLACLYIALKGLLQGPSDPSGSCMES